MYGGDYVLDIVFEKKKVQELFDDINDVRYSRGLMIKKVGKDLSKAIKNRYNQIKAFSSFYSLQQSQIGKIESLEGDLKELYSLRLTANYRLIIRPKSKDLSPEELKTCDTIIIEGVIDYHGRGKKHNWIIP